MSEKSGTMRHIGPHRFTEKQGQYLAFIYVYAHIFRQAPAEADMQRHFRDSKLAEIGGGTSEILRLLISREILK